MHDVCGRLASDEHDFLEQIQHYKKSGFRLILQADFSVIFQNGSESELGGTVRSILYVFFDDVICAPFKFEKDDLLLDDKVITLEEFHSLSFE